MCYTVIYQSICIIVFLFLGFAEIYIIMFMNISLHIKSSFAEHVPLIKLIIMRALINSPNKCYCSQSDIARCCFTLYYLNVFLCSYHVYVCSSHALMSCIEFCLHVDRKEYYVILVVDNCHVGATSIVIDSNMYMYIIYVIKLWLIMVLQYSNCSCLFSIFTIPLFRIGIIENLHIIQQLFLVYDSMICHFQPALFIGTHLIHTDFLRLYFRTTLMLTYSELEYVNNVLPGLKIYKYIWCELYTLLHNILIAIIIVIHFHFSHINVKYSGHTCNCTCSMIHNDRSIYLCIPDYCRILFYCYMLDLYFLLRCIYLRCRSMVNYNTLYYVSTNVPHVHIVCIHIYNNG